MDSEENMADGASKNLPEKLFTQHVETLKTRLNLISWREDVGDNGEIVNPIKHHLKNLPDQRNDKS